jgi:hypothetical protein
LFEVSCVSNPFQPKESNNVVADPAGHCDHVHSRAW